MTINIADNSPRISYTVAQGVTQTSFAVPFEFFDNADLNVYIDGTLKTITTHYTVSGGDGSTGTVSMSVTGGTGGSIVVITRDIELERTTDFPVSGAFNIVALNTELDRLIAVAADLDDRAARSIQAQDFDTTVTYTLPVVNDRKGKVLGFNASTGAVEAGPQIADVQSLANISADIATLADIEDGTDATDAIQNVNTIRANVTTVAGVASNVTTVAGISSNVTSVAGNATNINTVASNIASVNTVATNITSVVAVANDLVEAVSEVETVANDLNEAVSEIDTVATNIANVNTVGGISANVTTVAGISANVTTVAGISANVTTVAGDSANITTVAGQTTNLQNVTDNLTAIQNAAGNANSAATSATAAAASQTAAASSATAAAASQTAAAASAASAATSYDSFDDRYLGVKNSDPTTDNDGDALASGMLYFSSSENIMKVYDGASWIAATSAGNVSLTTFQYTATGGQTTFSGSDDNSATLSYTVNNILVTLNGSLLFNGTDYTATNGTSVVLASGAVASDVLQVTAFKSFTTADMVPASTGGTFAGNVNVTGSVTSDGLTVDGNATITVSDNSDALTIVSTDADANVGPVLNLYRNSASPADNDILGRIVFKGEDDAGNAATFARIEAIATDVSNGSEDARIDFIAAKDDSFSTALSIVGNQIGIGTSLPSRQLHLSGSTPIIRLTDTDTNAYGEISSSSSDGNLMFYADQGNTQANTTIRFYVDTAERMRIDSGNVLVGKTSADSATNGVQLLPNGISAFGRDGGEALRLNRNTSDGEILRFQKAGTPVGSIGVTGGDILYIANPDGSDVGFNFDGDNPKINPCNGTGSGTDGVADLGWSGGRYKDLYLSGGVYLGGTGAANKLEDYEEGTWTPSISTGGANVGYSGQNGQYTKIGREVYVNFQININSLTSSGSGSFQIGGLPFTPTSGKNSGRYVIQTHNVDVNSTAIGIYAYAASGTNLGVLYSFDNSGWSVASVSDFVISSSSIIAGSFHYISE